MNTVHVTEWSHPECDGVLVLRGAAMDTSIKAKQIMAPSSQQQPTPREYEMPADEFEAMPDFDG